jgi:hypothetical protein
VTDDDSCCLVGVEMGVILVVIVVVVFWQPVLSASETSATPNRA